MKISSSLAIPTSIKRLLKPLAIDAHKRGVQLFVVGGPVRDWLLKKSTVDIDLAVIGDPAPTAKLAARLLHGRVETFGRFGTSRILGTSKYRIDVATTRVESYSEPAALPLVTQTSVAIEKDLFRRDFTINAMALRLDQESHTLIDPYSGLKDLENKTLRVLHPASFRDDPTRVFRAARFVGRFRYQLAEGLGEAARDVLKVGDAAKLSRHRLLHEFLCILKEKSPGFAFALLETWGYLDLICPALPWQINLPNGLEPRLAALALELGPEAGRKFIESFPFEHQLRVLLLETLAVAFSDRAPKNKLPAAVIAAVRRAKPDLPTVALKPCFLNGKDLIRLGLKPGEEFHNILEKASRLQRLGQLKTKAAALKWLSKQ